MDAVLDAGEREPTQRETLAAIVAQCDHALTERIAKRFSTRDQLKQLERRAEALLKQEDGRGWDKEFERVFVSAAAAFDRLIAEAGGMPEQPEVTH